MKKLLIIVIALAVLIGFFFFFSGRLMVGNEIAVLMRNLEKQTRIDFSDFKPDEFQWNIEKEGIIAGVLVSGQSFEAKEMSASDYGKIETFFEENGFQLDIHNVVDGTVSGLVGYRLDSIACVTASSFAESETDEYDVTVKCGSIKGLEPDLSVKEEVLEVNLGESFSISLKANPSTGYRWEGMYDGEYVEFTDKDYIASSTGLLGSGGESVFTFKALRAGQTELNFYSVRSGEDEPIDQATYQVNIK